jgi:gas vesicle protein
MAQEPDRLRQDIEATRSSLTRDVDLLAEKTSPKKVAQRRWTAVKDKVMGSSESARQSAGDGMSTVQDKVQDKASQLGDKAGQLGDKAGSAAHDVADSVRSAPQAVAKQTQGNPLAAGIIAFGVGMLAATLVPVTDLERRAGQQLKDNAGDLTDRVKDVATEMKDDLSGTVQHAVSEVKETAQDAAQTTKDQAQSSAQDVKSEAKSAAS